MFCQCVYAYINNYVIYIKIRTYYSHSVIMAQVIHITTSRRSFLASCPILGTGLHSVRYTLGVSSVPLTMVPDTWQILYPAASYKHNAVFLIANLGYTR